MIIRTILVAIITSLTVICNAFDTLKIVESTEKLKISDYLNSFEDSLNKYTIDSILAKANMLFIKPADLSFNYGFTQSTIWYRLVITNASSSNINYILEIANPDIDHVNFYELRENQLYSKIETGELRDVSTRAIYHRNFLFNINLNPNETKIYYFSINNGGHSLFMPINLVEQEVYTVQDNKTELFYWLIYGLLIFIFLFNLYLFYTERQKLNLNYSLYVFFLIAFLMYYDGYSFYLNPPVWFEKTKYIFPGLYAFFLIAFTQNFISSRHKLMLFEKIAPPLKIIILILPFLYFFNYPIFLICDYGAPLIVLVTLIVIITTAIVTLRRNYTPSILFLLGYCFMFLGLFFHELKELKVIETNFFTENSIKIGFTLECAILTIAVLERFRIEQEEAKKTIESSYNKIEIQNKELEIINAELEKLSIVASETNNSVTIYDENGKIEWCNTYFEKFYKTTLNDLIRSGKDYIENIIPNKNIHRLVKQCLSRKTLVTFETQIRTDGMEEIWVQTTLSPLTRRDVVYKLIAIDSDITDLKQYEKNLELAKEKAVESDNLKTVFLGNMSHEIRTPLNGIMGFSDLLYNTEVDKDKRQKYLKMITTNGEQLLRIIDDIVDISLIESNQLRIDPTPLDLDQFLKGIIEFFEAYKQNISKSTIALRLENHINPIQRTIIADPIRLKQVLNNLINNGLKFTHEGYVRLACYKVDQKIQFCVEDTGIGLDPSKKEIIFERFRQVDERLNREYGGTGLGLSISKGIIEKMNGKIWVDSKEGKGLKICFHIPYVPFKKLKTVPSKTKIV